MRGWMKVLGGLAIVAAVFLVVGLILRVTRGSGEDATELVRRAAQAMDEVALEGTVVTVVRTPHGPLETRAQMHRGDGRFTMRLLSGPGEDTVVRRQAGIVWVERAGDTRTRCASVGDHGLRTELLRKNWTFTTAGTRRVAGRIAALVRGTGPGGQIILAVDRETGYPLYISRRDRQGEMISETTWVDADFSVQPPPEVEPPQGEQGRRRRAISLDEARAAVKFNVLEPTWLPGGWELQGWYLTERPAGAIVQARFSDGLRPMMIMQLSADDVRDRVEQRRERRREPEPASGHERPRRRGPERPDGPDQLARPGGPWGQQHAPHHMRGAGADASRRVIDGTVVIVSGPVSEETRERVLESMVDGA